MDRDDRTKSEQSSQRTAEETEPDQKPHWHFFAAFGCLCLVNLVCAIDATILSQALPTIAGKLHGTAIETFWSATSFLLTSTVFQPSWATFSHIFGRKQVLLAALVLFTLGSIIAAVANNFATLIAGRCVQGAGGGGIVALTYVIVTDLVTLRERGKWFGLISMQWAIGSVTGPILGGAFAEKTTWRWVFWINLPFAGIAFVAIPIFLRLHFKPTTFIDKLRRIDWFGSVFFIASLTSFLIPVTWGGIEYDWSSWRVLVPLLLGIAGLVGFVVYSAIFPSEPIIRGSIFKSRTAIVSFIGTVLHGMIIWSLLYYFIFYFQVAKDRTPIDSGVAMLPNSLTIAPSSVVVGILIAKTGRYVPFIYVGWTLTTLGIGLLCYLDTHSRTATWAIISMVPGVGLGILYSAMSFAIQASSSDADLPFAAAMFSFFRSLGQTLGVAVGGSIFQNQMRHQLRKSPIFASRATELSRDAAALVQYIKSLSAGQQARSELVEAYVNSLRVLWAVMCALAGVALVLAVWGTKEERLDRELKTEQGFRHSKKPSSGGENGGEKGGL